MKIKILAIVASLVLLAGCGSIHNGADPARLDLNKVPKTSGIAIISTGAPENCIATSTYLTVGKIGPDNKVTGISGLAVDSYAIKSDFTDHQGTVNALVLPAGDYSLSPGIANPHVEPIRVPKAVFSIAAGEVVYLGEYYMPVHCVLNPVSVFRDQRDRDMAIVMQRNPALAGANIVTRMPQFVPAASGDKK